MHANQHADAVARSMPGQAIAFAAARLRLLFEGSSERDRAQRNALLAFTVRVVSAGILYLSQIILARWMGASEYGIYVLVWTWMLLIGGLSTLGLPTLMMRRIPEYLERGDHALVRGLLRMGPMSVVATSTVIAAAALAVLWWQADRWASPYTVPVIMILACVPVIALSDLQDGIGRARGYIGVALVPPYILRPLLVLAAMGVAYLAGIAMTAVTAAASAIIATWLAGVVQTLLLNRRLAAEIPAGPREYSPRVWLAMSAPFLVASAAELLLQNADVLIMSRYLQPADVGIYFAAAKTMSLILFVQYAVASAVVKRLAALDARGDRQALEQVVREAAAWTFWPALVLAVGILAVGKPLLQLFGPSFTAAYPVMAILAVGFLARAATGPSEFVLNMLGEHRAGAVILGAVAVLNVVLNLLLVPALGIKGGALATALSLVVLSAANAVVAKRRLGLSVGIWSVIGRRAET